MQLYALNHEKRLVFVKEATKQQDYFCLECGEIVRVRGGMHRHTHYYHLTTTHLCRQNGKSMQHLQIQYRLQELFPEGECELECQFHEVNRIADVVWRPQKLIFEIQCSPISAMEVQNRNRDYATQGFQVIWILHDNQYNQWRLSAAENYLIERPHYFTDIDIDGKGMIYDQFALVLKGVRKHTLSPLALDLLQPIKLESKELGTSQDMPHSVANRLKKWPLYFSGDLVDLCISGKDQEYLRRALEMEATIASKAVAPITWLEIFRRQYIRWFVRPYNLLFQIILEKACK